MARLGAGLSAVNKQTHESVAFSVLAPSAILTPQRLRNRELARAERAPTSNDSPALRELRMFLQAQTLNKAG